MAADCADCAHFDYQSALNQVGPLTSRHGALSPFLERNLERLDRARWLQLWERTRSRWTSRLPEKFVIAGRDHPHPRRVRFPIRDARRMFRGGARGLTRRC